jgi:short-subunit dehydrogenase
MKVVIVGASGSLGGSLKSRGAELGMDLITVSRNSCEEHSSFTVDLLDIKNIEKSLEKFPVMTGNDVVIINSGVIGPVALASEQEAEAVVDTFTVNALSNAFLYKALYAKGIKNFVVISSGAALKDYKSEK